MPAQPLDIYRAPVEAAWIDYNGHMNVAYYVLMFDRATDALLDRLGLGAAYRRRTDHSLFVLESHVTYEREVKAGDMPVKDALKALKRMKRPLFNPVVPLPDGEYDVIVADPPWPSPSREEGQWTGPSQKPLPP